MMAVRNAAVLLTTLSLLIPLLSFTPASGQGARTIAGTVYALPGGSVAGTLVIACVFANNTCDEQRSRYSKITQRGARAAYRIEGLGQGAFYVLAWRDLNGNKDADAGDEVGYFPDITTPRPVTPPARGIDVRLQKQTMQSSGAFGPQTSRGQPAPPPAAAPPAAAPAPPASSVAPAELVGRWLLREATADNYNTATGGFASSDGRIYELVLTAQGGFLWSRFIQGTIRSCQRYVLQKLEGSFSVSGAGIVFQSNRAREIFRSRYRCASTPDYDRPIEAKTRVHNWRVGRGQYGDLHLYLNGGDIYLTDVYDPAR
jgi:hypothetical protein